jgi:hypothetical protein
MIANRYRKLEEQNLKCDARLFDKVLKCEDTEAKQQSESIVTLKVSPCVLDLNAGLLDERVFGASFCLQLAAGSRFL